MSMFQVDEALIDANTALANTNNPDDQNKILNLYNLFKKGKISKSEFNKGIATGAEARLNNDIQYVMNTLKTYGYPQQVLDSFKQNIDKILANTKDNNKIDAANQYIDQFLGDKSLAWQDLRRLDSVPGKPAPNQQPQKVDAKAAGGTQGSNNGSGSAQGAQADNGTYASAGVAKGGTKTVGYDPYDPNPGNVSLAYAMRNAPEQERKAALIDEWNKEHGRTGSTGYATGEGMLTSGSNGTYATGEGIETPMPADASSKFRIAWKDPMSIIAHYGRGAFTDDEYNQLVNHAVNDLGFNKELFSGSRYK